MSGLSGDESSPSVASVPAPELVQVMGRSIPRDVMEDRGKSSYIEMAYIIISTKVQKLTFVVGCDIHRPG